MIVEMEDTRHSLRSLVEEALTKPPTNTTSKDDTEEEDDCEEFLFVLCSNGQVQGGLLSESDSDCDATNEEEIKQRIEQELKDEEDRMEFDVSDLSVASQVSQTKSRAKNTVPIPSTKDNFAIQNEQNGPRSGAKQDSDEVSQPPVEPPKRKDSPTTINPFPALNLKGLKAPKKDSGETTEEEKKDDTLLGGKSEDEVAEEEKKKQEQSNRVIISVKIKDFSYGGDTPCKMVVVKDVSAYEKYEEVKKLQKM